VSFVKVPRTWHQGGSFRLNFLLREQIKVSGNDFGHIDGRKSFSVLTPFRFPEVAELRALVHRLQVENHEFRQQAGYRQRRHRDNLKRINALERKIEPAPMVFRACLAA
jgi:hypothetical protein